nr:ST.26 [Starmerella bombicola]
MLASERFADPRYFAKSPKLEYAFVVSILLGQIFTQAASNAALPLLQVLGKAYNSDATESTWYMSGFSLAQGTLILISGRIGDIYGLRITILCGYIWTLIWSILCGVAAYFTTPTFFIVARAMTGAGLAFVLPNVMGAAGRVYRPGTRRKHMIFSLIGLSAPLGGGVGPIIDGLIATTTSHWEWCFYHYAIGVAIALALAWWSVPYITPHKEEEPGVSMDWIGCSLGLSSLVLFNFVWNQAPSVGWDEPYIVALLVVSVLMLIVFFWYENKYPSNPLVPRQVMRDIKMMLTLLTLLLSWGSFGILFYRFFVFVEELRHYSPLAAGATMTPVIISGMTAALVCGLIISRVRAQYLLVVSMIMFMCSDIMMITMPVHQTYFRQSMGLWILGVWGMDWSFPAGSIILSDELPPKLQGMAGSLLTTMVMYGMSMFLGIAGTVEAEVLKRKPGDTLAASRACMEFAVGLSSAAVVVSIIVALMTLHKVRKVSQFEKQEQEKCRIYAESSSSNSSEERSIADDKNKSFPREVPVDTV